MEALRALRVTLTLAEQAVGEQPALHPGVPLAVGWGWGAARNMALTGSALPPPGAPPFISPCAAPPGAPFPLPPCPAPPVAPFLIPPCAAGPPTAGVAQAPMEGGGVWARPPPPARAGAAPAGAPAGRVGIRSGGGSRSRSRTRRPPKAQRRRSRRSRSSRRRRRVRSRSCSLPKRGGAPDRREGRRATAHVAHAQGSNGVGGGVRPQPQPMVVRPRLGGMVVAPSPAPAQRPVERGPPSNGSMNVRVPAPVALPVRPTEPPPPAGLFVGGLPQHSTSQAIQDVLRTLAQHSTSFGRLQGVVVRTMGGPRRNRAVFLAHTSFAQEQAATSIWQELTSALQQSEKRDQCTLPTPSGPVRLELAKSPQPNAPKRVRVAGGARTAPRSDGGLGPAAGRVEAQQRCGEASSAPAAEGAQTPRTGSEQAGAATEERGEEERAPSSAEAPRHPASPAPVVGGPSGRCIIYSNDAAEATECRICWQGMLHGDLLQRLPCMHVFHNDCANRWWNASDGRARCPRCNVQFL